MKKITLFVDGHWFDEPFQSTGTYLKGIYSVLADDPDFEIIIAAHNVPQLANEFNNNPNLRFVGFQSHSKYYRLAIDIPKQISKYGVDYAHYQYTSPLYKNTREIVTIHDLLFKDFPNQFPIQYRVSKNYLFARSAKRADIITTVSQYSRQSLARHYNIPQNKIILTPNGISGTHHQADSSFLSKYALNKYILCVSRIEPRKNHLSLAKAFVELNLHATGMKLVFIGRKDLPVPLLDQYIERLPTEVAASIKHYQGISNEELTQFYRFASVFVYPSFAEGFGIPPLEAAAVGTKVLCSNATAMADFSFFEDDLFDPHDLNELKQKLMNKIADTDQGRLDNIANTVLRTYDWTHIASDFGSYIKSHFHSLK